jgi:hypothetical protein
MRMLLRTLMVSMLCGAVSAAAYAESNAPALLPADGLYGLPAKQGGAMVKPLPAYISPDFLSAIGYEQGAATDAIKWFHDETTRLFPATVISTITPQNKYRTYVVSMQITRADQYSVNKPDGNVDIYLPLAVNVYFTNILTGEVLYSVTRTRYSNLTATKADYASGQLKPRLEQAYRDNLKQLTSAVLEQAHSEFKPLQISATVTDTWKGYYILNKGVDAGIATGNELVTASGAGLKIIQSGKSYAVGIPTLGAIHKGDELSFFSTATAGDVQKPRVLILDADTPSDFPGGYAATQFTQSLGSQASFTIVPVNPTFQAVLTDLSTNQGLQQEEVIQHRQLPNYFLRMKVLPPILYELPSNHEFAKARVFRSVAFAELVDGAGRVVYASQTEERLLDNTIDGGMAFDLKDRNKVLYANLISNLSKQFVKDVKFSSIELPLSQASAQEVSVKDPVGLLTPGASIRIYHKLSDVSGVHESVAVPIWEAAVGAKQGTDVSASLIVPTGDAAYAVSVDAKKDLVLLEGNGSGSTSNLAYTLCDSVKDIGTLHLPALNDVAYFALGSSFKLPYYTGHYAVGAKHQALPDALADYANVGFAKPVVVASTTTAQCIQPLIKISETSRTCKGDGFCELKLQVVAGIQAVRGDAVGGKKVLSVEYTISNAPEKDIDLYESYHAMLKTIELLPQAIGQADVSHF